MLMMNEKDKNNYLGYFGGKTGAERNPKGYQRRDDGNHYYKSDEYYEWWYVDASFDNGYHMVTTFHHMNMFLKPIVPSIQIMIYKPDGTQVSRYALIKPEENYAGADWCDVLMGENRLKDRGDGTYDLYVMINKVGIQLRMKNIVPGWKLGSGTGYRNEETGDVAGWAVAVPYGEAEGEIYLKDETIKVQGAVYHDHNWGNILLHKLCKKWYWGRLHGKKYTIDYAHTYAKPDDAPDTGQIMIARGKDIILSSTIMNTRLENMVIDEKTGQQYARKLTLTGDALGVEFQLAIQTKRLVETMLLPKSVEWDQYYFRFLADYTLEIKIDGVQDMEEGELLHEYMVLNP
jgi:predicted secreted hydrolase